MMEVKGERNGEKMQCENETVRESERGCVEERVRQNLEKCTRVTGRSGWSLGILRGKEKGGDETWKTLTVKRS